MFGLQFTPMDKESMQFISAMHLIRQMEDQELDKISPNGKNVEERRKVIRDKYKAKEVAVLRRAAGPFIHIVDEQNA